MVKKQNPKIKNVSVLTSYFANGRMYAIVQKDDTVRFYRLEDSVSGESAPYWVATDIYLKSPVAVIGLEE